MAGLKTILIYPEDIIKGAVYMLDNQGRMDLLGQILYTGYSIPIQEKVATPACQDTCISPFTTIYRKKVFNTQLTLKLLHNAKHMNGVSQINLANDLLEEFDIYLEKA